MSAGESTHSAESAATHEVWFGAQWRPAHVTRHRGDGWVRAIVCGVGNQELSFSPREVRPTPPPASAEA